MEVELHLLVTFLNISEMSLFLQNLRRGKWYLKNTKENKEDICPQSMENQQNFRKMKSEVHDLMVTSTDSERFLKCT